VTKTYTVKEIFPTIQGEGFWSGRAATFVRFAGCNLWTGLEEHRAKAVCQFCDTDFLGGRRYTLESLVAAIQSHRPKFVVFTGGEPGLQLDTQLVRQLQRRGFYCAVETNGTLPIPPLLDWVCVSPKSGTDIIVSAADELKLVYPQDGLAPWLAQAKVSAKHKWLSPMDGPALRENIAKAVKYVSEDCQWRLNVQAHKFWEIR
jgi:7-carboxy-7-deazaguanine synthase